MLRYTFSRIGQAIISIIGAIIVVFLLARATGDPTSLMLPPNSTLADQEALRASLGLDLPLWQQFVIFAGGVLRGDFGTSILYRRPSIEVVGPALLASAQLSGISFLVVCIIAIPAGVYAAYRRGRGLDRTVLTAAAAGQALPSFWVATILIAVFAVGLKVLPSSGYGTWQHFVLPVATIVIFALAGLMRITRSATLETLGTEYIRYARVKGVKESTVLWKHSFKNSSLSVLTFGSILFATMLSGSIIVETVFGWPGLGRAVVLAVQQRDFPVVQLIVLFLSCLYIMINLAVDLLYAVLNPRIRVS